MTAIKNYEFKENEVCTVDIHQMQSWEAKYFLERLLVKINPQIREVIVIHGYHNGTCLMNIVRKELKSRKIKRRFVSLNPGITSLIL